MLRAGPFSDESILRLANRRFIPFYFDLSNQGFAGDQDARAFVVAQVPVLGGRSVPTPDVLFMTPEGKLVGRVSNYASTQQVLDSMQRVLKQNPTFAHDTADERGLEGLERAQLLMDLQDWKQAARVLKQIPGDQARYLRGHLARLQADWKTMEHQFQTIKARSFEHDLIMERAHRLWQGGSFKKLQRSLAHFPRKSPRYTEARYYLGLALFHQDRSREALAVWKQTVKGCSQDPWIYRADWAYTGAREGRHRGSFSISSSGPRTSLLNRIGYMGRRNPDLAGPHAGRQRRL